MTFEIQTVLITGASRGIGLEHTKEFAARGVHVIANARSQATELHALASTHAGHITVRPYDAADPQAAAHLKEALGNTPI